MKNRLVLVINPRSSGYSLVHEKIVRNINRLNLAENQRITYEIQTTNPLDNAEKMAKLLQDDDTVLAATAPLISQLMRLFFQIKQELKLSILGLVISTTMLTVSLATTLDHV